MSIRSRAVKYILCLSAAAVLSSCASYYMQMQDLQRGVLEGDYELAEQKLESARFYKKRKNRLLYYLEKGRVLFMAGQYEESNRYLNEADRLMEDFDNRQDQFLGTVKGVVYSSAESVYTGEKFERILVHYYKALNYLYLNNTEDALVEARRINLKLQELSDKKKKGYTSDAFSLILQGMIYEKGRDYNNAFIAYRNAYELYEQNDGRYYGAPMPDQLKYDLVRTAALTGFRAEADRYAREFKLEEQQNTAPHGEVIVFWENGLSPVKEERNFIFTLIERNGNHFFHSDGFAYDVPWDHNSSDDLDIGVVRVVLPDYAERPPLYREAVVKADSLEYPLGLAENINVIASSTLQERMLKEAGIALGRLALKKLAEKEIKEENEVVGTAFGILAAAAEKADTRNWQSIPGTLSYTRIPLREGENTFSFEASGLQQDTARQTFTLEGDGRLHFIHFSTPEIL